jgi:hypothetical protein
MILVENFGAGNVGRHQVGRELDALEIQVEDLRQRFHQQRLGESRHAGDQAMAAAEQRHQHLVDDLVLPDNDLAQLRQNLLTATGDSFGKSLDSHVRCAHDTSMRQ